MSVKFNHCAIGPKPKHFDALLANPYSFGFLEFHTENLFAKGSAYQKIRKLREIYDFSLHSIGLSLGSADGICENHLEKIAHEIKVFQPILVSEHLSFAGFGGAFVPDLLPVPLNEQSLSVFVRNIDIFQSKIKRKILIENPSQYFSPIGETYDLGQFLNLLCQKTGCGILLDVNNLEVCRQNIGISPHDLINQLKAQNIGEIHLAGYKTKKKTNGDTLFLDNHGDRVFPKVWELYQYCIEKFGDIPTLLEWDNDVPEISILNTEAKIADEIKAKTLLREIA